MRAHDEHPQLVKDCIDRAAKLTDWERSFIDSIERQLEQDRPLSQKQADTLASIWERVT